MITQNNDYLFLGGFLSAVIANHTENMEVRVWLFIVAIAFYIAMILRWCYWIAKSCNKKQSKK